MLETNLIQLRKEKNLTQNDMADKLQIKHQTYSAYERGISVPDAYTLKKIADILNVTTDRLLRSGHEENIKDDEIKFALFNGDKGITDEANVAIATIIDKSTCNLANLIFKISLS